VIEPVLKKLGVEYKDRVDVWKVNADEQPDVLRSLGIYGIPTLIAFHCSHDNAWEYLRSDLDEERRCIGEIEEDKLRIGAAFPGIAALLDRIETDAKKHREEIRALLSNETRPLWAA
jgi:hypothetical protein